MSDGRWDARQRALLQALGLEWPAAPTTTSSPPSTAAAPSTGAARTAPAQRTAAATPEPADAALSGPAPSVPAGDTLPDLDSLAAAVRDCRACGLCATRRQAVPGGGHPHAEWMVVGEAPGEQEDARGEPFVGRSGELLDQMLAALGLGRATGSAREQVFIANTVKCRPPDNRNPTPEELTACAPFLRRQLALVKPRIVLALGRFAAQSLLGSEAPVGQLRGKVHRLADGTPVVVSYHPAYLLRQPAEKARAWDDLCLAAAQWDGA